jgi:hypothetical protein
VEVLVPRCDRGVKEGSGNDLGPKTRTSSLLAAIICEGISRYVGTVERGQK